MPDVLTHFDIDAENINSGCLMRLGGFNVILKGDADFADQCPGYWTIKANENSLTAEELA